MTSTCTKCGRLNFESLTLWDGKDYCHACITAAGPELLALATSGAVLEETVLRHEVMAGPLLRRMLPQTLWPVGFIGLVVASYVYTGKINAAYGAAIMILSLALLFLHCRRRSTGKLQRIEALLPRTISIVSGELRVTSNGRIATFLLNDISWLEDGLRCDDLGCATRQRFRIFVHAGECYYGCGRSPEDFRLWQSFFTLSQVKNDPPAGCLRSLAFGITKTNVFLSGGILLGLLMAMTTGELAYILYFGVFGMIDGAFFSGVAISASQGLLRDESRDPLWWLKVVMFLSLVGICAGALGDRHVVVGGVVGGLLNVGLGVAILKSVFQDYGGVHSR